MKTLILAVAAAGVIGAFQGSAPSRSYLTDDQWAQIERMPELDRSKFVEAANIDALVEGEHVLFLDVREPEEVRDLGTIAGYVNIPFLQLERRMRELPKDRLILTACNTGTGRAPRAAALLQKHGYKVAGFCGLRDYKGARIHPATK